jgi:uncharacterized membrane protein YgcG
MKNPTRFDLERELSEGLAVLREQPKRSPRRAAEGRAAFLAQARQFAALTPVPVSVDQKPRHKGWMHVLHTFFMVRAKEKNPMFGTLGTVLLILSLILGGSGVTVAAAQQSMPDDTLYPVKTWSEGVRAALAEQTQTQARFGLALELANRRAFEMQTMLRAGHMPPEAVQTRMQDEIDLALILAVGQADAEAVRALNQVREQLRAQEQAFTQLGPQGDPQREAVREQARTMLHTRLQACEQGIADPAALRSQHREQFGTQPEDPDQLPEDQPVNEPGFGPGPGAGEGSAGQGENNPHDTDNPAPASGYGPGYGEGSEGQGANNPHDDEDVPPPGSGYGPGEGAGSGAGPGIADGNGPGTSGTKSSGGDNGGNDDSGGGSGGSDSSGGDNGGSNNSGGGGGGGGNGGH